MGVEKDILDLAKRGVQRKIITGNSEKIAWDVLVTEIAKKYFYSRLENANA